MKSEIGNCTSITKYTAVPYTKDKKKCKLQAAIYYFLSIRRTKQIAPD